MVTTLVRDKTVRLERHLTRNDFTQVAAKYILLGDDLDSETYELAQATVSRCLERGKALGLTEREVVCGLLRPALSKRDHCLCAACRTRCRVCAA